jgi:hypothetical protein
MVDSIGGGQAGRGQTMRTEKKSSQTTTGSETETTTGTNPDIS